LQHLGKAGALIDGIGTAHGGGRMGPTTQASDSGPKDELF
jgi:hypothetical protein